MFLTVDEISALEKLIALSGQDWFNIRTPNFIWDNENKVRMEVKAAVKEFLSCAESHIAELTEDERWIIKDLWDFVNDPNNTGFEWENEK